MLLLKTERLCGGFIDPHVSSGHITLSPIHTAVGKIYWPAHQTKQLIATSRLHYVFFHVPSIHQCFEWSENKLKCAGLSVSTYLPNMSWISSEKLMKESWKWGGLATCQQWQAIAGKNRTSYTIFLEGQAENYNNKKGQWWNIIVVKPISLLESLQSVFALGTCLPFYSLDSSFAGKVTGELSGAVNHTYTHIYQRAHIYPRDML